MKWSFSEKDNGFVGYSVHRDFRGERADFQTRKLTLVDNLMCNIHFWIMETLWIHCHVRKLFRKNTLCNQYTINKRRPVVQRPSRLKSKNSRTPAGWPSQRGTHLSNFDDSSTLLRSVGVAENFERREDFWKVTVRGPCPVGPSLVRRPSRLKSDISRTPTGCPSQRGTHLSNFDDSSILVRRIAVTVSENFEKCEDFWKVTFRAPICLLLSVLCSLLLSRRKAGKPASPANTKAHPRKHLMINSWFCFPPPSLNCHLRHRHPTIRKR